MLSVQNKHLVIEDTEENTIEHARGGRGMRRPRGGARRSSRSRWALGAAGVGAAAGGILLSRNKRVRGLVRRGWRSAAMKKVRGGIVRGVRKVRGSSVGLRARRGVTSARKFAANRLGGVKRIGGAVKNAANRVYKRAKTRVASAYGKVAKTAKARVKATIKRAKVKVKAAVGKSRGRGRTSSRAGGRRR